MRICERCGKEFNESKVGKYSSGRFCSRSCANSRVHSDETKKKISQTILKKNQLKRNQEKLDKNEEYALTSQGYRKLKTYICAICGKEFRWHKYKKTCSRECSIILNSESNKKYSRVNPKVHYRKNNEWLPEASLRLKKYYFIYKTTNLINGKYYIGMHQTDDLTDGYLGSGCVLTKAIRKYGRENFKREEICFCNSYKELTEKEHEIIMSYGALSDPNCYNLNEGGIGGPNFANHKHTEATKQKLREARLLQVKNI